MRVAQPISATSDELRKLHEWRRGAVKDSRVQRRAWIILESIGGNTNREISNQIRVSEKTVRTWQGRFKKGGPAALFFDLPRSGRPRLLDAEKERELARMVHEARSRGVSLRRLAGARSLSKTTLWRISRRSYPGGRDPHPDADDLARILGITSRSAVRSYLPEYWQRLRAQCECANCFARVTHRIYYRAAPHPARPFATGTHFSCSRHLPKVEATIRNVTGFQSMSVEAV
jgi:transposase